MQQDYILRMIQQLGAFVAGLIAATSLNDATPLTLCTSGGSANAALDGCCVAIEDDELPLLPAHPATTKSNSNSFFITAPARS